VNEKTAIPREVAEFMTSLFDKWGELEQSWAAVKIHARLGEEFVYLNENGNWAIDRRVLKEFKKLTPDKVWIRRGLRWEPKPAGMTRRAAE
jgi:hypothetical protein